MLGRHAGDDDEEPSQPVPQPPKPSQPVPQPPKPTKPIALTPGTIYKPGTLADLQRVVRENTTIRVIATGHSGAYYPTTGIYLKTTALNKILSYTDNTVTVESGKLIGSLIEELSQKNLMITTLPSIFQATIGGTLSTGSHGTGTGSLATVVTQLQLVKGDGELVTVKRDNQDFPAAVMSVGLLGVLYSVTLETAPLASYHQTRYYSSFPKDWVEWLTAPRSMRQLLYNPYRKKVLSYDLTPQAQGNDYRSALSIFLNEKRGAGLVTSIYDRTPALVPDMINASYRALSGRFTGTLSQLQEIPEYNVDYLDYEASVPVEEAAQVLIRVQELLDSERRDNNYYLWFGIFLRYLKQEPALLAQSYEGDMIAFEFTLRNNQASREFLKRLQPLLGNRFHPGKYSTLYLHQHAQWIAFDSVRRRYDPSGKFAFDLNKPIYSLEFKPGYPPEKLTS